MGQNGTTTFGSSKPYDWAEDILFISAQSAGERAYGSWTEQAAETLRKLRRILSEAGVSPRDIVKVGIFYHQSLIASEADIVRQVAEEYVMPGSVAPILMAVPLLDLPEGNLLQIELIGLKPSGRRARAKKGTSVSNPNDPFSRGIKCDDLIFVGAQSALDSSGKTLYAGDFAAQSRVTVANIKAVMDELGTDFPAVAKVNVFFSGTGKFEDWSIGAKIRAESYKKPGPGATTVPIVGPFPSDQIVRHEVIAIVNEDGTPYPREVSWPEGNWDWPIPMPYEQGVMFNKLIVLGGQISATPACEAVLPGQLGPQTTRTMETIRNILAGFGAIPDDLAKLTIFYNTEGSRSDLETVLREVEPFFSKGLPALTLVPLRTMSLPDLEIEIEGFGILGKSRTQ